MRWDFLASFVIGAAIGFLVRVIVRRMASYTR